MVNFPMTKIYNAYLIETSDFASTKKDILNFAISIGFDRNLVLSGNHPDILFNEYIDEKIKMQDIKDIVETAHYSPTVADKKFYVIYDAVNLEDYMQNALLKTLEEPAIFDSFFLVTSNVSKMFDTIKSRCIFLKDTIKDDYKKILSLEFLDEAIRTLANVKYEDEADIMLFAEKFDKKEGMFHDIINIYRYILRDVIIYKKTLSKEFINVKEKEMEFISIANSLSFEEIGFLIDELDKLAMIKGYQIDKKIAIFNFLRGINGEVFRNKV